MSRDSRGDDVERDAHRSRTPAQPVDGLPLFGGALAGDEPLPPAPLLSDTEWLSQAQARVDNLTPLQTLQDATALADAAVRDLSHASTRRSDIVTASQRAEKRAQKGLGAVLKKNAPKDMARKRDHATSTEAALVVEPHLSAMQQQVLDAFRNSGAMTDETLERLPEFSGFKYSTARKRRTELVTKSLLASCGKAMNSTGSARMTLWDLAERVKPELCVNCGQPTHWQNGHAHTCEPAPDFRPFALTDE
jgi:hypothetical protein